MAETDTDATNSSDVQERAYRLMMGLWSGQILYTAESVGILDCLADGPKSRTEVARECSLHSENTYRLLRALSHHSGLERTEDDRFGLTPIGECFLEDHPQSLRAELRFARSPEYVSAMLHLPDLIRQGGPCGFIREFDSGLYEYAETDPEFRAIVDDFMTSRLRQDLDDVLVALKATDIGREAHLCDVGGGHGTLLARLLEEYSAMQGTVFDLPGVIDERDQQISEANGVEDRCHYASGDMFERVPTADGYLLKEILHNWNDEACIEILSTVHESAPPDARLFIVEGIVPESDSDHPTKQLDIVMMVLLDGFERTEPEYSDLLKRAGWLHTETVTAPSDHVSVLAAEKN